VFFTLAAMEAQLRKEDMWDEHFELDLTAPKTNTKDQEYKGLYWGDSVRHFA
jgi:hypothetical protein